MSDNMAKDLVKGTTTFSDIWRVLLCLCALGWFLALVAGLTSLMAMWWFGIWVIPLTVILFHKAALSYFNAMDDTKDK